MLLGGAALTRTTSSATCARSTRAGCSTARTRSRACTRWTRSWTASASGALDPDFGRALGGRDLPARKSRARPKPRSTSRPGPTSAIDVPSSRRRSSAHASPRASRSTRSRRTSTRPRCSATSGSSGPRSARDRRRVQGRHPAGAPRAARRSPQAEGTLVPAVAWGYFPVNADGDDLVVWTDDDRRSRAAAVHVPAPAEGPLPLHLRLLPARRLRRGRLRGLPRRDDGAAGERARARAVRGRPVPGLPAAATASRWR